MSQEAAGEREREKWTCERSEGEITTTVELGKSWFFFQVDFVQFSPIQSTICLNMVLQHEFSVSQKKNYFRNSPRFTVRGTPTCRGPSPLSSPEGSLQWWSRDPNTSRIIKWKWRGRGGGGKRDLPWSSKTDESKKIGRDSSIRSDLQQPFSGSFLEGVEGRKWRFFWRGRVEEPVSFCVLGKI